MRNDVEAFNPVQELINETFGKVEEHLFSNKESMHKMYREMLNKTDGPNDKEIQNFVITMKGHRSIFTLNLFHFCTNPSVGMIGFFILQKTLMSKAPWLRGSMQLL